MEVIAFAMVGMILGWVVGVACLTLYAVWLHFHD